MTFVSSPTINPHFILAIDGGGTKTIARLIDTESKYQWQASAGASSLTNDFFGAINVLEKLIKEVVDKSQCQLHEIVAVFGLAGAGNAKVVASLKQVFTNRFAFLDICSDAKTSAYGANNGNEVAVVALGTGSVGMRLQYNENGDLTQHFVGGWGFLLGDEGGGAKLGLHAVQLALSELDNFTNPLSQLTRVIIQKIGQTRNDILTWSAQAKAVDYAMFSPIVFQLYATCSMAQQIITNHVQSVEALIDNTQAETQLPVVLLGGLAEPTLPLLSEVMKAKLKKPCGNALDGAYLLAKEMVDIKFENKWLTNKGIEILTMKDEMKDKQSLLIDQLNKLATEGRNPDTMDIDLLDSFEIVQKINTEDQKVAIAVKAVLPNVALAVDKITQAFSLGARLIFIGAGTSGRLGVLDAAECVPTFSVPSEQVVGLIAGGADAILKAVEGAEDSVTLPVEDLKAINLCKNDVVVGLAASGRTPYVLSAMKYAKSVGATTVGITCSPNTLLIDEVHIDICPVVGAEALTGSTRMKSATAQKMVLNMLTTASMIKSGKSYQNLMVDVNASNEKLYARAVRIVMQATNCDYDVCKKALDNAKNNAKLAILLILTGVSVEQGEKLLENSHGFLRKAVQYVSETNKSK